MWLMKPEDKSPSSHGFPMVFTFSYGLSYGLPRFPIDFSRAKQCRAAFLPTRDLPGRACETTSLTDLLPCHVLSTARHTSGPWTEPRCIKGQVNSSKVVDHIYIYMLHSFQTFLTHVFWTSQVRATLHSSRPEVFCNRRAQPIARFALGCRVQRHSSA